MTKSRNGPDMMVDVANCPIGHGRNDLRLERYRISIEQTEQGRPARRKEIRDSFAVTTRLCVKGLGRRRLKEAERVAEDVCWLLSFATMSQVRPVWFGLGKYGHGPGTMTAVTLLFRPTIATNTESVANFLVTTWSAYRRLKTSRRLPAVIDYLVYSELSQQPIQAQLLLVFVVLESLKHTHNRRSRQSFQKRLEAMFRGVGMRVAKAKLRSIVKLRNELVHEGISRLPIASLSARHDLCHDLIREYLLRLLDYRGSYLVYSQASREVAQI